jgi:type IV pilus biogenesis protein CpaD/CtpE
MIMMTLTRPARGRPVRARPVRIVVLALASALALAACEEQPVGSFRDAQFVNEGARARQDLYFQPGGTTLRPGEAGRLRSFLAGQYLTPETDILVSVTHTGSPLLDARRRGAMQANMPRTVARVRLVAPPEGELGADMLADVARVEVVHYNRLLVRCPGNPAADYELTTPLPNQGCSNAINLATHADQIRDLTAPRDYAGGSEGVTSVAAIERHRAGKVITTPLGISEQE